MRSRTAEWFETRVQYDKVQEDGMQKKVTEQYVVDALSFTEAESAITEKMKPYISGDYKIKNITPANYHEVFFSDSKEDVSGTRLSWLSSRLIRRRRRRSAAWYSILSRQALPTPHSKPSTTS